MRGLEGVFLRIKKEQIIVNILCFESNKRGNYFIKKAVRRAEREVRVKEE